MKQSIILKNKPSEEVFDGTSNVIDSGIQS